MRVGVHNLVMQLQRTLFLFKLCSMSGGIVFKNGGPFGWLDDRQDRTSLSSCEAEIRATSATSKKVVDLRNLSLSFTKSGFKIPDINQSLSSTMTMTPVSSGLAT